MAGAVATMAASSVSASTAVKGAAIELARDPATRVMVCSSALLGAKHRGSKGGAGLARHEVPAKTLIRHAAALVRCYMSFAPSHGRVTTRRQAAGLDALAGAARSPHRFASRRRRRFPPYRTAAGW